MSRAEISTLTEWKQYLRGMVLPRPTYDSGTNTLTLPSITFKSGSIPLFNQSAYETAKSRFGNIDENTIYLFQDTVFNYSSGYTYLFSGHVSGGGQGYDIYFGKHMKFTNPSFYAKMAYMFAENTIIEDVVIENCEVGKSYDAYWNMFSDCTNLKSVTWNGSLTYNELTRTRDFSKTFKNDTSLETVDLTDLNLGQVRYINELVSGCTKLKVLKLKNTNLGHDNLVYTNILTDADNIEEIDFSGSYFKCGSLFSIFKTLSKLKKLNLSETNLVNVSGTTLQSAFKENRVITAVDLSSSSLSTITSTKEMFYNCKALTYVNLSNANMSNLTDASYMFYGCDKLTTVTLNKDSGFGSTSKVTDMSYLFYYCIKLELESSCFTSYIGSKVCSNMQYMFYCCKKLPTKIYLTSELATTANVSSVYGMFEGCESIREISFSDNFCRNAASSGFSMSYIFDNCSNLQTVSFGINMAYNSINNLSYAFYGCTNLNVNTLLSSSFKVGSKCTSLNNMFSYCGKEFEFVSTSTNNISNWNTSGLTSLEYMFRGSNIKKFNPGDTFKTDNVTTVSSMFYKCSNLTEVTIPSNFCPKCRMAENIFADCSNLTTITNTVNMKFADLIRANQMFKNCTSLNMELNLSGIKCRSSYSSLYVYEMFMDSAVTSIKFSDGFCPSNTTLRTYEMFKGCSNLSSIYTNSKVNGTIDISTWRFGSTPSIYSMFEDCSNINVIKFINTSTTTGSATIHQMFKGCSKLTTITNFQNIVTSISDAYDLFNGCTKLTSVDVSNLRLLNNTNSCDKMFMNCSQLSTITFNNNFMTNKHNPFTMKNMFYGCLALQSLDLSNWNTSYVTDMSGMFYNCKSLVSIEYGSNFQTNNVTDMSEMFACDNVSIPKLGKYDLTHYTFPNVTNMENFLNIDTTNLISIKLRSDVYDSTTNSIKYSASDQKYELPSNYIRAVDNGNSVTVVYKIEINTTDDLITLLEYFPENIYYETGTMVFKEITFKLIRAAADITFDNETVREKLQAKITDSGVNLKDIDFFFDTCVIDTRKANAIDQCRIFRAPYLTKMIWENPKFLTYSYGYLFAGCNMLKSFKLNGSVLEAVGFPYLNMFYDCSSLETAEIDKDFVIDGYNMSYMFRNCSSLKKVSMKIKRVNAISNCFTNCSKLTDLDIEFDDAAICTSNRNAAFNNCSSLKQIDLSKLKFANNFSFEDMFYNCRSLQSVIFNSSEQSLGTSVNNMFRNCESLQNIDLSMFSFGNITTSISYFLDGVNFEKFSELRIKKDYYNKDTNTIINGNRNLYKIPATPIFITETETYYKIIFNIVITNQDELNSAIDNGLITYSNGTMLFSKLTFDMTDEASNLSIHNAEDKLNSLINDGKPWNDVEFKFENVRFISCSNKLFANSTMHNITLTNTTLTNSNDELLKNSNVEALLIQNMTCNSDIEDLLNGNSTIHDVTINGVNCNGNMKSWLQSCSQLTNANISNITCTGDISAMLMNCTTLTNANISHINANSISYMFSGCTKLESIESEQINVSDASYLLNACNSLETVPMIDFNSKLESIDYMFSGCTALKTADLSSFINTTKLSTASHLFDGCTALKTINLSGLKNSHLSTISYMLNDCNDLKVIDFSEFNFDNVTNADNMENFLAIDNVSLITFKNQDIVFSNDVPEIVIKSGTYNLMIKPSKIASTIDTVTMTFKFWKITSNTSLINAIQESGLVYNRNGVLTFLSCGFDNTDNVIEFDNESVKTEIENIGIDASNLKIDLQLSEVNIKTSDGYTDMLRSSNINEIVFTKTDLSGYLTKAFNSTISSVSFDNSLIKGDVRCLFQDCINIKNIDFSTSTIDISEQNSIENMFYNCTSLETVDISTFDLSGNVKLYHLFDSTYSLNEIRINKDYVIEDESNHKVYIISNNCINEYQLEKYCTVNNENDIAIITFELIKITNYDELCQAVENKLNITTLTQGSSKKATMSNYWFQDYIDDQGIGTDYILEKLNYPTELYIYNSKFQCNGETTILTKNGITTKCMLMNCVIDDNLTHLFRESVASSIIIQNCEIKKRTSYMFVDCKQTASYGQYFSFKILEWINNDTGNVTDMSYMFQNCDKLSIANNYKLVLDFDTSNVINMDHMFDGCETVQTLDIRSFDLSKVTSMNGFLYNCPNLSTLIIQTRFYNNGYIKGQLYQLPKHVAYEVKNGDIIEVVFKYPEQITVSTLADLQSLLDKNEYVSIIPETQTLTFRCVKFYHYGDEGLANSSIKNKIETDIGTSMLNINIEFDQCVFDNDTNGCMLLNDININSLSFKKVELNRTVDISTGDEVITYGYNRVQNNSKNLFKGVHANEFDINNIQYEEYITSMESMFEDSNIKDIDFSIINTLLVQCMDNLLKNNKAISEIVFLPMYQQSNITCTRNGLLDGCSNIQSITIDVNRYNKTNNSIFTNDSYTLQKDVIYSDIVGNNIILHTIDRIIITNDDELLSVIQNKTNIEYDYANDEIIFSLFEFRNYNGDGFNNATIVNLINNVKHIRFFGCKFNTPGHLLYDQGKFQYITMELCQFTGSLVEMFRGAKVPGLNYVKFIDSIVTGSTMEKMFFTSNRLIEADLSGLTINDTVTTFNSMFMNCTTVERIKFSDEIQEINGVTDAEAMFMSCWKLREVNIDKLHFTKLETAMHMFYSNKALNKIKIWIKNPNTEKGISLYDMFSGAGASEIDLSDFDTKIQTMTGIFSHMTNIKTLDITQLVKNCTEHKYSYLVYYNKSIETIKLFDYANKPTSPYQLKDASSMFCDAIKLHRLNMAYFTFSTCYDANSFLNNTIASNLQYIIIGKDEYERYNDNPKKVFIKLSGGNRYNIPHDVYRIDYVDYDSVDDEWKVVENSNYVRLQVIELLITTITNKSQLLSAIENDYVKFQQDTNTFRIMCCIFKDYGAHGDELGFGDSEVKSAIETKTGITDWTNVSVEITDCQFDTDTITTIFDGVDYWKHKITFNNCIFINNACETILHELNMDQSTVLNMENCTITGSASKFFKEKEFSTEQIELNTDSVSNFDSMFESANIHATGALFDINEFSFISAESVADIFKNSSGVVLNNFSFELIKYTDAINPEDSPLKNVSGMFDNSGIHNIDLYPCQLSNIENMDRFIDNNEDLETLIIHKDNYKNNTIIYGENNNKTYIIPMRVYYTETISKSGYENYIKACFKYPDIIEITDIDDFVSKFGGNIYIQYFEDTDTVLLMSMNLTSLPENFFSNESVIEAISNLTGGKPINKLNFTIENCVLDGSKTPFYGSDIVHVDFIQTNITGDSVEHFFSGSQIQDISFENSVITNATKIDGLFRDARSLETIDMNGLTIANDVTSTAHMFDGCISLVGIDLTNIDTSNVTDMSYMFNDCTRLTSVNLGEFDTRNVTDMSFMFSNCKSLINSPVDAIEFESVTNLESMFNNCRSITLLYLTKLDTANVTNMNNFLNNTNSLSSLVIRADICEATDYSVSILYNGGKYQINMKIGRIFNHDGLLTIIFGEWVPTADELLNLHNRYRKTSLETALILLRRRLAKLRRAYIKTMIPACKISIMSEIRNVIAEIDRIVNRLYGETFKP